LSEIYCTLTEGVTLQKCLTVSSPGIPSEFYFFLTLVVLARLRLVASRRSNRNEIVVSVRLIADHVRPGIFEINDKLLTWAKSGAIPLL